MRCASVHLQPCLRSALRWIAVGCVLLAPLPLAAAGGAGAPLFVGATVIHACTPSVSPLASIGSADRGADEFIVGMDVACGNGASFTAVLSAAGDALSSDAVALAVRPTIEIARLAVIGGGASQSVQLSARLGADTAATLAGGRTEALVLTLTY